MNTIAYGEKKRINKIRNKIKNKIKTNKKKKNK